jgi:hypothetical protein
VETKKVVEGAATKKAKADKATAGNATTDKAIAEKKATADVVVKESMDVVIAKKATARVVSTA